MADDTRNPGLPGILRLTPHLRRRIYGLVWATPWLNQDRGSKVTWRSKRDVFDLCGLCMSEFKWSSSERDCLPPAGFCSLLLSCRTIYSEASALLYSSNWFFCHYATSQSLAPLRALRPETVASLTYLKVVLNQASCHCRESEAGRRGPCCDETRIYNIYYGHKQAGPKEQSQSGCWYHRGQAVHDLPLRRSHASMKPMLTEWHKTAAYLGKHATPGQLELSVVCDVYSRDVQLAKMVVDALRHFPPLKDCHIRLSRTPDPTLRDLARDAVLTSRGIQRVSTLTSPPPPLPVPVAARLTGLPRELRLRILEYTDLIPPLKEVMWTRQHGKYVAIRAACPRWEGMGNHGYEPDIHHGCQFSRCSARPLPEDSIGCFCGLTHAAFSSTCRCWAPPTPLFLISRLLYQDATLVFFSENRFAIIDSGMLPVFGPPRHSGYNEHRLAACQFLRDVVPASCLGYLRFLELVFPPDVAGDWPKKGGPVLGDWSETIDQVSDKLNLPALTIRVLAVYHEDEDANDVLLSGHDAKHTMESYFHLLQPLTRLAGTDGLAGFHADLTWPWRRTQATYERGSDYLRQQETDKWMQGRERWLKERAERFVLGDRYDRLRLKTGAQEPETGAWWKIFVRDY
ncbi:hypothetical protein C8A01DRAFT_37057 [Parachaetomium inaequale]|uniref:F-box domain-containing protein n=1 Tax=Parachaetomium inaequale TaxID=2588326 RepID=A0AAN6PDR1_9PEZI|nr:hypothetical protein C8A01DRAFT_37057 [Parachaetomium inaequale]